VIYVDPYLTDYVQHVLPEYGLGFKRMMATLLEPEEVEADYVISTHSHAPF
jgi:L-ascorbate metabolism protein UlaG (beta-lactamase superfamily)